LQGIIAVQAVYEFQPSYTKGLTIAVYIGMLVGALFWGATADIIGRKIAFNVSLFICSIFTIVAGAAPNWASLGFFIAMAAFGAGGNLILDTTVFLEYLPSYKQYLVSCLAAWWGIGCTIAGLVAWAFMSKCCSSDVLFTATSSPSSILLSRRATCAIWANDFLFVSQQTTAVPTQAWLPSPHARRTATWAGGT
jgi:MFS family permease